MNSKSLIIAFVTVSIAALIVSAFAVFSVARTYSTSLATNEPGETVSAPEKTCAPPAETSQPETEGEETTSEVTSSEEITSDGTDEATSEAPATDEITTSADGFTLSLSQGRLTLTDPAGDKIYERIIDPSRLHPKDCEALLAGLTFADRESAMSAVYDLIS